MENCKGKDSSTRLSSWTTPTFNISIDMRKWLEDRIKKISVDNRFENTTVYTICNHKKGIKLKFEIHYEISV